MREVGVLLLFALLVIGSNGQKINSLIHELHSKRLSIDVEHIFTTKSVKRDDKNYRLPKTIYPTTYNIVLEPKLEGQFFFNGDTNITAKVVTKTNEIVLHHGNLHLHECHVYVKNVELKVIKTTFDNVTEKFSMVLKDYLLPNTKIQLYFKFQGKLNDNMAGFYRSSYYDSQGNKRWLATTQFEPTYARHAFPCFDEPAFKAIFNLYIRRPKNYTTLTNMPLYESKEESNTVLDIFESSPKMSSYLVAIVVSDFASVSTNGSNVRTWVKKSNIKDGAFAQQFGTKVLDALGNLLEQKNPVPKTDMVAVPDFAAGAMENWGLITYREQALLSNDTETPDNLRQAIATVISHESAHMWFGNLVTLEWWDFTWLNEGFANYFENIGAAKVEPSWKLDQQYLINTVQLALFYDSNLYSPPVVQNVSSREQIVSMFGMSSYYKGGSLIRMMHQAFGSEIFYGALQDYIAKRQYSNVNSDHLWEALQNQINKHNFGLNVTVKKIMHNWIMESGHPTLMVEVTKDQIALSQKRDYLIKPNSTLSNMTWYIPVTYASGKNPNFTTTTNLWINKSTILEMKNATNDWIVFNNLGAGFYRVNYDTRSWYRIIKTLNSKHFEDIHEMNRAVIVDDLMHFARNEVLDYGTALDCLQYIAHETNYLPIKSALYNLKYLISKFSNDKDYSLLAKHVLNLIQKSYKKVEFYDDQEDDRFIILLRMELNSLACKLGHKKCQEMATKAFNKWKKDLRDKVPKNQRSVVYCHAIKEGTPADWEFLKNQYNLTNDVHERFLILKSLGCTRHRKLMKKYLLFLLTEFDKEIHLRKQESMSLFYNFCTLGLHHGRYVLEFIVEHHLQLSQYYGGYDAVGALIYLASTNFNTASHVDEFERYVNENSVTFSPIASYLNIIVTSLKGSLVWHKRNSEKINHWLHKTYPYDIVL